MRIGTQQEADTHPLALLFELEARVQLWKRSAEPPGEHRKKKLTLTDAGIQVISTVDHLP